MPDFFDGSDLESRAFGHQSLHVYRRGESPSTSSVLVLIHGFNGSGYGTWGGLPSLLLEGAGNFDVALFDYVSGSRRSISDSPSVESTIDHLVQELESLSYDSIFLAGHSMGGLIAMGAVRQAFTQGQITNSPLSKRIKCCFTLATPLAGTKWLPFGIFPISERRVLAVHSNLQQNNAQFFADLVNVDLNFDPNKKLWIPHFVARATGDRVVDRFSATGSTPSERRKTFRGGHSKFIKGAPVAHWLLSSIEKVEQVDHAARRNPSYQNGISASFKGHPLFGSWMDSYLDAIAQFNRDNDLKVKDLTGQIGMNSVQLRVEVVDFAMTGHTQADIKLSHSVTNKRKNQILALGIAILNASSTEALDALASVAEDQPNVWIEATPSLSDLSEEIFRWLNRVHKIVASQKSVAYTFGNSNVLSINSVWEENGEY